jgi:hypothetical protein
MLFDQLSRYSISIEIHPRVAWIYVSTKVDTHQGQAMPFQQIAEICRRRGGSGCGGVSAMDGATELTWTYLQRPPQPDPPRHPTVRPLLQLLRLLHLIWRVQGAALPTPPPTLYLPP